jgi:hypothetical protein
MSFKKITTLLLIASTLSTTAFANSGASEAAQSPEATLLENVVALKGSNLSDEEFQKQLTTIVSDYTNTAPMAGQQERLKDALVDLRIYTPAQAEAFEKQVQDVQDQISSAHPTSVEQTTTLLNQEITQLAQLQAPGAQFSMCAGRAVAIAAPIVLGTTTAVLAVKGDTMPAVIAGFVFALSLSDFTSDGMSCN